MQMKTVKEKQMTSQFERQLKKKKNYMKKNEKFFFQGKHKSKPSRTNK